MARRTQNIIFGLGEGEEAALQKSVLEEKSNDEGGLVKSILNVLEKGNIQRLSLEKNPDQSSAIHGIYEPKIGLVPDSICKRIAIQDSLVANIVRARQNHMSAMGRPRPNKYATGYVIEPETGILEKLSEKERDELNARIKRAVDLFWSCGHTEGVAEDHQRTFSEYLSVSTRSAVVCGRIATEIIYTGEGENKKFAYFAATDAGTIYKASPASQSSLESVRRSAYETLCRVTGKKLDRERFHAGEYKWVQVINGTPHVVYTADEMKVYNFYPAPDVELNGYPVTPIDTVITAITTHINITHHNRLYFESGRATKGMLVIQGDNLSPTVIHNIKQQFNASINNVRNSWRMPVFGCSTDETITWHPIDHGGGRDMEFQYLTDLNAREILTAFMLSPDELPGWSYLSRGTANQALSESNNEYRLTAARDVGLRPLIAAFEDFINAELFPLIDPELAKICKLRFVGLDAETAEKEAVRTQQDMSIWMTYDDVLERAEKRPVGKRWAGSIPLNPVYKSYLDQYFTVGEILEHFCGIEGASKNPELAYRRDGMFFQWQQMLQQREMMAQQMKQQEMVAAQQMQHGQQPEIQGRQGAVAALLPQDQDPEHQLTEKQKTKRVEEASAAGSDPLARSIDYAYELMTKSEDKVQPALRRVLKLQQQAEDALIREMLLDAKVAKEEILKVVKHKVKE